MSSYGTKIDSACAASIDAAQADWVISVKGPRERKLFVVLLSAFLLAATVSGVLAVRLVVRTIYWSAHQNEPIEGWMPLGYVAHSYGVSPVVLQTALGLPIGIRDRRPLSEVAAEQGKSFEEARKALEAAIAADRKQASETGGVRTGQ
ncbi:hypothetical protein [Neorhizobium sp. T25_13]|uniref:hypothetical protein n=1 Tax=Neorhizobium sp. T25_13 TaxID=2093830 RepID=UPI00155EE623|nr:hypothetical protein [Neorhizobium sp. T25_13]